MWQWKNIQLKLFSANRYFTMLLEAGLIAIRKLRSVFCSLFFFFFKRNLVCGVRNVFVNDVLWQLIAFQKYLFNWWTKKLVIFVICIAQMITGCFRSSQSTLQDCSDGICLYRDRAYSTGKSMCERLKDTIPRQMFEVAVQAAFGGKIIARET